MNLYDLLSQIIEDGPYALMKNSFLPENMEKLDTDEQKVQWETLKNAASLCLSVDNDDAKFIPAFVWDGKRSFAVEDFSDSDYQIMRDIEWDRLPLNLRARVTDILWTFKRDYKAGLVAAESYYSLFEMWFASHEWMTTLDVIKRTISISMQLNNKELKDKACASVWNKIIINQKAEDPFLLLRFMDILLLYRCGDTNHIKSVANSVILNNNSNPMVVEQAYGIKRNCAKLNKDEASVKQENVFLADYFVQYCEDRDDLEGYSAFQMESILQKAYVLYINNGEKEKAETTLRKLTQLQAKIPQLLVPIAHSVDVSDLHTCIDLCFEELSCEEAICRLIQLVEFYTKDTLKAEVIKNKKEFPINSMFRVNRINMHGQTIVSYPALTDADIKEENEVFDLHLNKKALEKMELAGDLVIDYSLRLIREKYAFNPGNVDFLIKDNPIIPKGRESIIGTGLLHVLNGECYEAMHILAPQVENLFRSIAKEVGGITITLENDGSSKEKVLRSVFEIPELVECYDNDILFIFRVLLNEKSGANIRNEIAHGLVDEAATCKGVYLFFAGAVFKLLSLSSVGYYKMLANSEKLQRLPKGNHFQGEDTAE